ncbi:MAG: hypothetical protein JSR77_07970 [Planctomycetes bacterium]|nr:hypothetical protein [Planctomycetota bacterium]
MWDEIALLDCILDDLAHRERQLVAERAVRGLDALDELELHDAIGEALAAAGLGVWREQPYPGEITSRRRKSERERCDFVLTRAPDDPPRDPMIEFAEAMDARATLFANAPTPDPPGTPASECYWLEVKVVGQFAYADGVPRANSGYASDLVRSLATDLQKLRREPIVQHGAVLLLLFTADETTAKHDLPLALHRVLDRDIYFRPHRQGGFAITDRIGNAWCSAAWVGVVPGLGQGE